jgi:hypothetical protein
MGSVWIVWCRHCNKNTTALRGKPDKKGPKAVKRVQCSVCNKDIDPYRGAFRTLDAMRGLKPKGLLEIA